MIGLLAAAAAVLVVAAGLAKSLRPAPAVAMLTRARPGRRRRGRAAAVTVRLAALAEIGFGLAFLVIGGRLAAALLAVTYLVFALLVLRLMRVGSGTSCGCFGRVASPIGRPHLLLDLVALAAAVAAVARPVGALGGLPAHGLALAAIGTAQVLLLAGLGYLSITALPALAAARRPLEA